MTDFTKRCRAGLAPWSGTFNTNWPEDGANYDLCRRIPHESGCHVLDGFVTSYSGRVTYDGDWRHTLWTLEVSGQIYGGDPDTAMKEGCACNDCESPYWKELDRFICGKGPKPL
jgi:hypothetical protein